MLSSCATRTFNWLFTAAILAAAAAVIAAMPGLALLGAAALMLAPGVAAARWLGLDSQSRLVWLFIVAALSLALTPIIALWTSLLAGFERAPLALGLASVSLLLATWARLRPATCVQCGALFSRRPLLWSFVGLLALMAVMTMLPYLQVTSRSGALLATPVTDWPKHFAVIWLIERTGLPPANLLYPPWPDRPLAYYYFFHSIVASLRVLSGGSLSILGAFTAVTIFAVVTFLGLLTLLAGRVLRSERAALFAALFASVIGGLDLIPLAGQILRLLMREGVTPVQVLATETMVGWASCLSNLHSFYSFFVWTPQHLTAGTMAMLIAVLYGLLGRRLRLALVMPVLLLAVVGYSVYVAVPVFVIVAAWAALDVYGRRAARRPLASSIAAWVAVAAGVLAVGWPYLSVLWASRDAETAGLLLRVANNGTSVLQGALLTRLLGDTPWARLLDAPLFYLIELGSVLLLGVAGWWAWRRNDLITPAMTGASQRWREIGRWLAVTAALTLLLTLFLVSKGSALGASCNDFRMRGSLPLQIVLACFAGLGLEHLARRPRRPLAWLLLGMVLLGLLNTAWDLRGQGMARFITGRGLPAEAQAAYAFVRQSTPVDAIFQGGIDATVLRDQPLLVYGQRLSRVAPGIFPLLQVPLEAFRADSQGVDTAFRSHDAATAWTALRRLRVDYVFIGPEERATYRGSSDLGQFDDGRHFEPVYLAWPYAVYRVRD